MGREIVSNATPFTHVPHIPHACYYVWLKLCGHKDFVPGNISKDLPKCKTMACSGIICMRSFFSHSNELFVILYSCLVTQSAIKNGFF